MRSQQGENNYRTKLSTSQVQAICLSIQNDVGKSLMDIAIEHGVSYGVVKMIYSRGTWKHVSKDYDFSGHQDARYRTGSDRTPSVKGFSRYKQDN